jgi:hypothetical protein
VSKPKLQGSSNEKNWVQSHCPKHSPIFVKRIKTKTRDSLKKEKEESHNTGLYLTIYARQKISLDYRTRLV